MLVAQNSLGPVCPVPLTVRGNPVRFVRRREVPRQRLLLQQYLPVDERAVRARRRGLRVYYALDHEQTELSPIPVPLSFSFLTSFITNLYINTHRRLDPLPAHGALLHDPLFIRARDACLLYTSDAADE